MQRMNAKTAAMIGVPLAAGGYWWYNRRKNVYAEQKQGGQNIPGDRERVKTRVGEGLSSMMQSLTPLKSFDTHISTIKHYGNNYRRQVPVHEYIMHINEDVMQALIMDCDRADAKLIGVEYIISEKLYKQLPEEEKKLWYSKGFEAKSGAMVAPRMPMAMEHKLMKDLAPTYAKSISLWHSDRDQLPLGLPQFMVAPTKEGMLNFDLLHKRDKELGIDTEAERKNRADIQAPLYSGSWTQMKGCELTMKPVNL